MILDVGAEMSFRTRREKQSIGTAFLSFLFQKHGDKKRRGPVGMGPEEGCKSDQRAGAPLLRGQAKRLRVVQSGEEKAPGRSYCSLPVLKRNLEERWGQMF